MPGNWTSLGIGVALIALFTWSIFKLIHAWSELVKELRSELKDLKEELKTLKDELEKER